MVVDNNFYMNLALLEAWKYQGLTYPNPAVGCVVVSKNNEILAIEAHKEAGKPHAEVNALQQAYFKLTDDASILSLNDSSDIHTYLLANHNNLFQNISLYTTLEPCSHLGKTPSCALLIAKLGIKQVYLGSYDRNEIAHNGTRMLCENSCEVHTKLLQKECEALLFPFQRFLDGSFVFFKWAQRLNGTTDEGTISTKESRRSVHKMRNVCDLLIIGGNTVRRDKPTLDARLVDGKAPDILILSQKKEFDKTIPLFHVPNRKVFIEDNFSKVESYKNIMIEGGAKMYALTREIVDYYLCYLAPSFGGKEGFNSVEDKFEILNIQKEDTDIIMWMKRI